MNVRTRSIFTFLGILISQYSNTIFAQKNIQKDKILPFLGHPDGHKGRDSLDLVLLPQIKIPTKTLLDSVLYKEFQISLADYFYYFASYNYLKAAQRSTLIRFYSHIPILNRENNKKLEILLNGNHLLDDLISKNVLLSKVKEINRVYIIKGGGEGRKLDDNHITINFIVNQNYIGTDDEIKFSRGVTLLKTKSVTPNTKSSY